MSMPTGLNEYFISHKVMTLSFLSKRRSICTPVESLPGALK
jgi:hypothetical protein